MAQKYYFLLCNIMKHKTQDYKITAGKIESHIVDRNNIISTETLFHRNKFALYRYLLENKFFNSKL